MRFTEVCRRRLTGFSSPIFGASWDPDTARVSVTRTVLVYEEEVIDPKDDVASILHGSHKASNEERDIGLRCR